MPIFVHRYNGDHSTKSYDLSQKTKRTALKSYMTTIAKKATESAVAKRVAIKKLKYIAITTHSAASAARCLRDVHVKAVMTQVKEKLSGLGAALSDADLALDPESLFTGLSAAESKAAGDTVKRKITKFTDNVVPSLSVPADIPKPPKATLDHAAGIIARVKAREGDIREHAAMRVKLFWLLCVAYYKTGLEIEANQGAVLQHGKATPGYGHAACHTALCSNVNDNNPLGKKSLIEDTHLKHVLNMTRDLPVAVNKADSHMESEGKADETMRYHANEILNRVSRGELNPVQAMTVFYDYLSRYFLRAAKTFARVEDREAPIEAKTMILSWQIDGMFSWARKTDTPGAWALSLETLVQWLKPSIPLGTETECVRAAGLFANPAFVEGCLTEQARDILAPVLAATEAKV